MRVILLRMLCRSSVSDLDGMSLARDFTADSDIVIRRTHLYEDAFEKLSLENGAYLIYLCSNTYSSLVF